MSRPSVSKAVRCLQKLGLAVTGVEISPDGTVRVLTTDGDAGADDDLDFLREHRRARKAGRLAQGH